MLRADPSRVWLPELVERFARCISGNDVACNLRLVNKATAAQFRGRHEYTTVRLSQPVPPTAFARRWAAPGAMRHLPLRQRQQLLCLTAASGMVSNMEVAMANVGVEPRYQGRSDILEASAGAGQLQMCEWLLQQGFDVSEGAVYAAARSGHQAVWELFISLEQRSLHKYVHAAARAGNAGLLESMLLLQQQQQHSVRSAGASAGLISADPLTSLSRVEQILLLRDAAEGCDLPTLQSLYQRCFGAHQAHGTELRSTVRYMLSNAAGSPSPDWQSKVEWLESLLPPEETDHKQRHHVCGSAAASADAVSRLTWLRRRGYTLCHESPMPHGDAIEVAAEQGNVAALEFFLEEGVHPRRIRSFALSHGLAQSLAGRLGNTNAFGPKDGTTAVWASVWQGDLSQLQWAVRSFVAAASWREWLQDPELAASAARTGNTGLLAWLHEQGAPLRQSTFLAAVESGCEETLEWLAERGCLMGGAGEAYVRAAKNADLAMLRCLQRLRCWWGPLGKVFMQCVTARCELPVLRFLVEAGCPVDWERAHQVATEIEAFYVGLMTRREALSVRTAEDRGAADVSGVGGAAVERGQAHRVVTREERRAADVRAWVAEQWERRRQLVAGRQQPAPAPPLKRPSLPQRERQRRERGSGRLMGVKRQKRHE